ncbi:hypothetical protein DYD21_01415 [Rhodohalobacter sp. SW132]|uniref:hypothetical protein n=1 Tax=Rhodohalobacter sp. SW132 TaxID=2293433 RepID=UPI000E24341C|nr:hypothetical protein [Rhodohalobacter sp. SW132]REL38635.1 hypothetical protein DYD21_01415 [Rhodohalobacter sp. SW132]
MNVLINGLLWSGSSAVTDLLKEYEGTGFVPGEFDEFRRPGLVGDHLEKRISKYYPSKIETLLGNSLKEIKNLNSRISDIDKHTLKQSLSRLQALTQLYRSLKKGDHQHNLQEAKLWIDTIRSIYGGNAKWVVFDQPLLLGQHFKVWPEVFSPYKMIIVYRSPKDQMAEIIRQGHLFKHMRSATADIYGGDRMGAVKFQIDTLKARINWADKILEAHGPEKVIHIGFEKLVNHYEEIKRKIENFLNVKSESHTASLRYFDPGISVKNIGIYQSILNRDEIDLLNELQNWYDNKEVKNPIYE